MITFTKKMLLTLTITLCVVTIVSSKSLRNGYITNGENVSITKYPFMVSIEKYGYQTCGGSIIAPNWILIAAHCINKHLLNKYQVRVGTSYPESGGNLVEIEKIYIHPNYELGMLQNDICLLELKEKLKYTEKINSIKLPSPDAECDENTLATVLGFGLNESWERTDMLNAVNISIINLTNCKNLGINVIDSMICAGKNGIGSCNGDSGGPLVQNDEVIGVVSLGYNCAYSLPGVYIKVSSFVKWITGIAEI